MSAHAISTLFVEIILFGPVLFGVGWFLGLVVDDFIGGGT